MPHSLLTLVSMVLEGPSIKDQSEYSIQAAPSIAQLLKFNCVKRNLVDKLSNLGLCISYDRVLSLSAEMGNSVCSGITWNRLCVCQL